MSKIIKVTIEYDDKTYIAEGEDAEQWLTVVNGMSTLCFIHGQKGFNNWTRIEEVQK